MSSYEIYPRRRLLPVVMLGAVCFSLLGCDTGTEPKESAPTVTTQQNDFGKKISDFIENQYEKDRKRIVSSN